MQAARQSIWKLVTLIKCEIWEHRGTFLVLPAVLAGVTLLGVMLILTLPMSGRISAEVNVERIDGEATWLDEQFRSNALIELSFRRFQKGTDEQRGKNLTSALQLLSAGLLAGLWLVQFFYFLNCLYTERQDSSILFWKSLPVSDSLTVVSKLITGSLVLPGIYIAMAALLQFVLLLLYTALVWFTLDTVVTLADLWETIWRPANLPGAWSGYVFQVTLLPLWYLVWFGWLLAVSAWSSNQPFLWAIGVPALAGFLVHIFSGRFFLQPPQFLSWVDSHTPSVMFADWPALTDMTDQLLTWDMLVSSSIGVALIVATIWQRGKTVVL